VIKKILKRTLIGLLVLIVVTVFHIHIFGNFYQIDKDAFRSGQLNKYNLEYYLKKHKIKTVLNFRGEELWDYDYVDEKRITKELNIKLVNYGISNGRFLGLKKTSEIVEILKTAQKPILIHCWGGSDRTSLGAALYQYAIAGKSVEVAREEFSWVYGHVPFFREKVIAMDKSFDNYVLKEKLKK
jgi:protein tyrosine/serine phosphatase